MKVRCPYCNNAAKLITGDKIYPHRSDLSNKKFWICVPCDAYVGTHKNSKKHAPLGRLANAELRQYKSHAHRAFDPLWKTGLMKRKAAYALLANKLGINIDTCHIGMFDVNTCKNAVNASVEIKKEVNQSDK